MKSEQHGSHQLIRKLKFHSPPNVEWRIVVERVIGPKQKRKKKKKIDSVFSELEK